jgi:hypothetical protein
VLPPDLAAFGFTLDAAGADAALAARTATACRRAGAARITVVGAHRWGLVAEIARAGLDVVAFDASREVLAHARDGLSGRGLAGRVTLFASDPRDAELPDGTDAALVPSTMWRMLLHPEAQSLTLDSLRRALRGPALLLLDLDRVPPLGADPCVVRSGPGRQTWRASRRGGVVRITCASPGVAEVPLDLSAAQPEDAVAMVRASGFRVESATDAGDGSELRPGSARMWLVARKESS